jgi:hypothetical protein
MRVVVEHGASFLQLFGDAARPEVLRVDARGRPVDFEEERGPLLGSYSAP